MNHELHASGLSFGQLFAILQARKFTVLVCFFLTLITTIALTQAQTKSYTANAELFIDFRSSDPLTGRLFNASLDAAYMQTQVEMMKSQEVLNQMISSTGMMGSEVMRKRIIKEGEAKAHAILYASVEKNFEVGLRKTSRVVDLKFSSDSPEQARDALNAALKAYIDLVQRVSSAPAKSRQEQYSAQLEALRQEQDKIQSLITEYQQKHEILDADERLDTGSRQLNELSTRQSALQSLRLEANSKKQSVRSLLNAGVKASEISEVAMQRGLPELRLRLAELERQLAEVGSVYGKNHPKFKMIIAERETLLQRIDRESQIALDSFLQEGQRFDDQSRALAGDIQNKQRSMLEMKKHRDVIGSYHRQLESVQRIYNSAVQKYDELLIASTVNSPTLTVLQWATAPIAHSKPNLRLNMLMSIPVGLLLGLGLVFLTEVSSRRLRHVDDLERNPEFKVLGRAGERSV